MAFGLPDKKKIATAFQGFKERLAAIRDQSKGLPPPGSPFVAALDQRITNLERFIQELSDSL